MTEGNEEARLGQIAGWAAIGIIWAALVGIWSFYKMFDALGEHNSYNLALRVGYVVIAIVVGAFLARILFLAKAR
jgi:uncharacterized membrane protein